MSVSCSLFVQILKSIPRGQFDQIVRRFGTDRLSRGFNSWRHFVSMMFCQLARAHSLREIEHGLRSAEGKLNHLGIAAPAKSTLAYANEHRSAELFEALFYQLLENCRSVQRGKHKLRFRNPLKSFDSTSVEVVSQMYDWAKYNKAKGAIKLHLVLDHDGYLPSFAVITDGQQADITVGRMFRFDPGTVIVFDRGYIDYEWFRTLGARKIWFVTRLKKNAHYTVLETRKPPAGILCDQVVDLIDATLTPRGRFDPIRMRRVEIEDPHRPGNTLVFFSNLLHFGATTIAAIYKERWQIEQFFKTLKQNLKIKTFIGTSFNAIKIQLWTALIAMLLIRYLKLKSQCPVSLSNLIAMLRFHLFAHRDLWDWLSKPFTEPDPSPPLQLHLANNWTAAGGGRS